MFCIVSPSPSSPLLVVNVVIDYFTSVVLLVLSSIVSSLRNLLRPPPSVSLPEPPPILSFAQPRRRVRAKTLRSEAEKKLVVGGGQLGVGCGLHHCIFGGKVKIPDPAPRACY
ncbi:hypothetical protein SAY87_031070 [Trapa incisa]|uniref:Uncharacterized protein n=1 Tax=Trapa incisa TaxID=236973 RepID=A0AAN7QMN9_9MYRT|nr:hypothetical protein SAY87_031070 [Trapa incisa]